MACDREFCENLALYACAAVGCNAVYCSEDCQAVAWQNEGHRVACTHQPHHIDNRITDWVAGRKNVPSEQEKKNAEDARKARAAKIDASAHEAEEKYKKENAPKIKDILREMVQATTQEKQAGHSIKPAEHPTLQIGPLLKTTAIAGVKLARVAIKSTAGAVAEVGDVTSFPFDEIVDAISVVVDALVFVGTTLKGFYDVIASFAAIPELVSKIKMLVTFDKGPQGCAEAVDAVFEILGKLGLKKKAQEFVGTIIGMFEKFIRWAAPLIGSVFGFAIPYDATFGGTAVEFFLYIAEFIIEKAWLLLSGLWDVLPRGIRNFITNKAAWTSILINVAEVLKNAFPVGDDTWKSRMVGKVVGGGFKAMQYHPAFLLGVLNREKFKVKAAKREERITTAVTVVDRKINEWIDNVLIPNMDKIPTAIHAALGLGFSTLYMFYAYTPDGARKKISVARAVQAKPSIGDHLRESETARTAFCADQGQRFHEIRSIMCEPPSEEGLSFIMAAREAGIKVDPDDPMLAIPEICERNFAVYRRYIRDE